MNAIKEKCLLAILIMPILAMLKLIIIILYLKLHTVYADAYANLCIRILSQWAV